MNYRCEIHYLGHESSEDRRRIAVAVCHHCGKPICQTVKLFPKKFIKSTSKELCGYIIDDPGFFHKPDKPKVEAYHCEACLVEYHPVYISQLQRLKSSI